MTAPLLPPDARHSSLPGHRNAPSVWRPAAAPAVVPTFPREGRPVQATLDFLALPREHGLSPGSGRRALPVADPRTRALVEQLTRAEHSGRRDSATRLGHQVVSRLMAGGRYSMAVHWAEWSMQLHGRWRAKGAPTYRSTVREWALAKLALGRGVDLEQRWGPGLTRLPSPLHSLEWFLGGLGSLLSLRRGDTTAATDRCRSLWNRATRRCDLVDLANAYVQVMIRLGNEAEARQVGERVSALAGGLDTACRSRALLACGIALSTGDPGRSCALLESCREGLAGVWKAQAAFYLAQGYRVQGRQQRAEAVVRDCVPCLLEIDAAGLSDLLGATGGLGAAATEESGIELRFLGGAEVRYRGRTTSPRLRFAEFLTALARNPRGLSAEQLALTVYGESGNPACCKTELSRLKQLVPIESRPYRIPGRVWADFLEIPSLIKKGQLSEAIELYRGPLLPASDSPDVRDLRTTLEESLRTAVLDRGDPELLWSLASRIREDLELWEALHEKLPAGDPRRALARAQVNSLQRSWAS